MKNLKNTLRAIFVALFVLFVFNLAAQNNQNSKSDTKYGKNIITLPAPPPETPPDTTNLGEQPKDMLTQITYLDNEVLEGAYYTECSWIYKAYPDKVWVKEHTHDFDEVFGFYGSDPENPKKLYGEIELWIGGEKHTITESCLVFVPKGVDHCPLVIKKVDRPIFMFTSGPSTKYTF